MLLTNLAIYYAASTAIILESQLHFDRKTFFLWLRSMAKAIQHIFT